MTTENDVHGTCEYCTRPVDGVGARCDDGTVFHLSCADGFEVAQQQADVRDDATVALDL